MAASSSDRKWWKRGSVYHVFPAAFCDSNGDGVGDLHGIQSKLDYISSLGVKIIRLCPVVDGPQVDMGNDPSSYQQVYAPFGSVQDMEKLILAAHGLGMRVIMDLVINHTSDLHSWFKESRSSRTNSKRDWYIWRGPRLAPDGTRLPPNDWGSRYGEGNDDVWTWDDTTQEYYFHQHSKQQPDLNWANSDVRSAIHQSAMVFWLDKGIDGFHIDGASLCRKPNSLAGALTSARESSGQLLGAASPDDSSIVIGDYVKEINKLLVGYNAIVVGESLVRSGSGAPGVDIIGGFHMIEQQNPISLGLEEAYKNGPSSLAFNLSSFKDAVGRTQDLMREDADTWSVIFLESHKQARCVSRLIADSNLRYQAHGAKLFSLLQISLSGTLSIYQGQEIGSVNTPLGVWSTDDYADIESQQFISKAREASDNGPVDSQTLPILQRLARDHARVPVAWDASARHSNSSRGHPRQPWLRANSLADQINVESQLHDPLSVLNFYRRALNLRNEHAETLAYGQYQHVRQDDNDLFMLVKTSSTSSAKAFVVLNFAAGEKAWEIPTPTELGLPNNATAELKPLISTQWTPGRQGGYECTVPLTAYEGRIYLVSTK